MLYNGLYTFQLGFRISVGVCNYFESVIEFTAFSKNTHTIIIALPQVEVHQRGDSLVIVLPSYCRVLVRDRAGNLVNFMQNDKLFFRFASTAALEGPGPNRALAIRTVLPQPGEHTHNTIAIELGNKPAGSNYIDVHPRQLATRSGVGFGFTSDSVEQTDVLNENIPTPIRNPVLYSLLAHKQQKKAQFRENQQRQRFAESLQSIPETSILPCIAQSLETLNEITNSLEPLPILPSNILDFLDDVDREGDCTTTRDTQSWSTSNRHTDPGFGYYSGGLCTYTTLPPPPYPYGSCATTTTTCTSATKETE